MFSTLITTHKGTVIPIFVEVLSQQKKVPLSKEQNAWLQSSGFRHNPGEVALVPDRNGNISFVLYCYDEKDDFWQIAKIRSHLPEGTYAFETKGKELESWTLAFALDAYQFTKYKKQSKTKNVHLYISKDLYAQITPTIEAICKVRDLINTPANDMLPEHLEKEAEALSKKHKATLKVIKGKSLLKEGFPLVYAVGKAGESEPRFISLRWGKKKAPLVVLIGKGVCFDTGGLNIKPTSSMRLMKKDMGGAAHVLGLASLIMSAKLPLDLLVLLPVVENNIAQNAMRPGDVYPSRSGQSVEIGHTDAEGRLILADAITYAMEQKPSLVIDIATLTGAARVALGLEIAPYFTNEEALVKPLEKAASVAKEAIWQLPLWQRYKPLLTSSVADLDNDAGGSSYGGAILAALFLEAFVKENTPWIHFDIGAWNQSSKPGRPQGGEAMILRTLFAFLKEKYQ